MPDDESSHGGDGLVIFCEPHDAIKANKLLKTVGWDSKITAPPPKLRMGCCALGLEINLAQKDDIELLFKNRGVAYHCIVQK